MIVSAEHQLRSIGLVKKQIPEVSHTKLDDYDYLDDSVHHITGRNSFAFHIDLAMLNFPNCARRLEHG